MMPLDRHSNTNMARRNFIGGGLSAMVVTGLCLASPASLARGPLRISVDTAPNHVRNEALKIFVSRLQQGVGKQLDAVIFSSAQLSKDRDVVKGLYWGLIDIAAPATSKLSRFDANANLFTLPMFYGTDLATVYEIGDGDIGIRLYERMARKTRCHVLGRSIDLGFTNLYTTTQVVTSAADIRGLKIRVPGSRASLDMYALLGANPVVIAFPDLAIALSQGNIDAVQTTHETLRSGRLWESGIRYCYEEHSSYIGYVPLISLRTWRSLSAIERDHLSAIWESVVDEARLLAQRRQADARGELVANNVEMASRIESLTPDMRQGLIDRSLVLASELNMDSDIVLAAARVIQRRQIKATA